MERQLQELISAAEAGNALAAEQLRTARGPLTKTVDGTRQPGIDSLTGESHQPRRTT